MKCVLSLSLMFLLAPSVGAAPTGDSTEGKRLHEAHCIACHDTSIYTRKDSPVRSWDSLRQQLDGCGHRVTSGLSANDAQNIVKYLNDRFYRFPAAAARAPRTGGALGASGERDSSAAALFRATTRMQPFSGAHRSADPRDEIRIRYEAAGKVRTVAERNKQYATLVDRACAARDFDLAVEIADTLSSVDARDNNYAKIVYQAILARDFPAADKAARRMSSVELRNQEFDRITGSCPPNAAPPALAAGRASAKQ